tara:strand:- start:164 stop:610 length:447 start_codon:yes stop_codon:yes gene_type:complete
VPESLFRIAPLPSVAVIVPVFVRVVIISSFRIVKDVALIVPAFDIKSKDLPETVPSITTIPLVDINDPDEVIVKDELVPLFVKRILEDEAVALKVMSAFDPVIEKVLEQSEEIVVVPDTSSQAYDTLENVEINKIKTVVHKIEIILFV